MLLVFQNVWACIRPLHGVSSWYFCLEPDVCQFSKAAATIFASMEITTGISEILLSDLWQWPGELNMKRFSDSALAVSFYSFHHRNHLFLFVLFIFYFSKFISLYTFQLSCVLLPHTFTSGNYMLLTKNLWHSLLEGLLKLSLLKLFDS